MKRLVTASGVSILFLIMAPGLVAGYIPWIIGGWRFGDLHGGGLRLRWLGVALVAAGAAALVECFARFVRQGLGTPAPMMPTDKLIVSGMYRYVRNPMYLAVVALVLGQALCFGRLDLIIYAGLVWLMFHGVVLVYEEPTLGRQFPHDYPRFIKSVPRWIPRLRPWRG